MADEGARGITRRQLAADALTLGGALAFATLPADPASAAVPSRGGRPTLRYGSARHAGLLSAPLRQLVTDAEAFLAPSPEHPWYAGAVLLAGRGGTVALHRPIGMAVRYQAYDEATDTGVEFPADRQIPMAEDTVFDLASVSKLFTSILAVQQIERGALGLEAAVASYLPDFGRAGKQNVTIRQLLTHTSGFRAWIPLYDAPTYEEKVRLIYDETPAGPPGTAYLYSDLNLISLQLVLEKVTGRTLDVLLHDEITGPLGMRHTRYNPPASWKPRIAATEDARAPWSGLDRGLVWGEVHDENAYSLGGVAGHAGVFSHAWDLAVLGRTLLNGGAYGRERILTPESVELMFTDFNTAFPGDEHGLGFELYQHWYMGALATPRTAGHTGFTGTSLVLDPTTDSFLVVLGNSVHPVRGWRSGSAPRVAAANQLARAVPVRPARGRTAWFSGMAGPSTTTLTLPALDTSSGRARLRCALWWDTEPRADVLVLEASVEDGTAWQPVPFTTVRRGGEPEPHPSGTATGWSGRVWHELTADLPAARGLRLRWRYTTDRLYAGRGAYVDAMRVETPGGVLFDESRPADAGRVEATGWTQSTD
ncbi:serine hydrolase domain-containing protein [Streptomyces griseoloalbus]|uniref:CubicO group peptidase (Beta-lactamase class C family) n=1 Tax=Streptomyces griseoloalbus TaxID=67303 RepID=A0A7W8BKG4_9ACTN|nr:serine hydrolase domain-containing protein [Streptomyces albaduncus]MBB5125077.1 CubicO group peptidase (beta-lactamase class C family) [Streptomyces albaduncus]GGW30288.1 serine hydrolase [Streptomyces albaduncus]